MTALTSWMKRKKAALCALICILAVSLAVIANSGGRITENRGGSYAVKLRHYGIDALEIERSLTIPLEDALSAIPGVLSVISSSENSLSSVFIRFKSGGKGKYEAVRDAAQRVYETLPSSVQRPEILSTNNSRIPVWSASVYSDSLNENVLMPQTPESFLEKILKPRLESLEGTGEVIISGTGLKQIFIIIDQEKLSSIGLNFSAVISSLAMNDSIFPGGSITHQNREIILTVDGRYGSGKTSEKPPLEKALIPLGEGKYIELCEIAQVIEQERTPDILSRLNGKKTAGIAVMGRHDADLRKLSSEIKKELSSLSFPFEFIVLSDLGAEEAAAFQSVLRAALTGAIMTAIISFFLNRKNNYGIAGFSCALAIPLICIVSAAVLSAAGYSVNRLLLAGIAAGVGTAIDSVILCSEKICGCKDSRSAAESLSRIANPLIAGATTTVAALLPLTMIEDNGAKIIASAVGVITIVSLVISLAFLPPLLMWKVKPLKKHHFYSNIRIYREFHFLKCFYIIPVLIFLTGKKFRFLRLINRFLAANVRLFFRYPLIIISVSLALTISAVILLFIKGADTGNSGSEDSLYAQIEFDGGLLAEEADRLLALYGEQLANNAGIKNVETGARTGSGSLLVSFDQKKIKPHQARELARNIVIPGGFIFFPENSARDRYWEIKIYGDEDQKCKELAENLAKTSMSHPLIKERILNFKDGGKKLILLPDREIFSKLGITFTDAALNLRQGVYGPVAYKRIGEDEEKGEIDVRIFTGGKNFSDINKETVMRQTREDVLDLLVPVVSENEDGSFVTGSITAGSLMKIREETEPSSVRRDNRRRTASITITTKPMDARRVKKAVQPLFENIDLPPGYSVEFDPDAVKQAEDLTSTVLSLLAALLFCYMIMASINESFIVPLIVLAAIPPSLSIPALCLGILGGAYNISAACAFIAVSGMTVNAAILCVDSLRRLNTNGKELTPAGVYYSMRKKLPVLLSTTITTITCALPFLFLGEEANAFIKTMSLTGALGVASSCLFAVTLIPSIYIVINKLLNNKSHILSL